jgi:hypothetical protein
MSVSDIVLTTVVVELLEGVLQYSKTIRQTTYKLYSNYYSKSPFLFFGVHIGYMWIMFLSLAYDNLSWPLILALALKVFDIFSKLDLINRVVLKPNDSNMSDILDMPIPFWVYLTGIMTYPYLVYLAFSSN